MTNSCSCIDCTHLGLTKHPTPGPRMAREDEEVFRVCADCLEEISGISAGDESWDYCEGCNQTEGPTCYVTEEKERVIV